LSKNLNLIMKQKLNGGFYMLNSKKDLEALKNGDIFKSSI